MFTGIVETVGEVAALEPRGELTRVSIEAPAVVEGVRIGDSVAVNGACLTVTAVSGTHLDFEAVKETLDLTSLGDLGVGSRINVERAMRADGRLDGHIVQGHVDGTGTVRALERDGDDVRLYVECGPEVSDYLVPKGSVNLLAACRGASFSHVAASSCRLSRIRFFRAWLNSASDMPSVRSAWYCIARNGPRSVYRARNRCRIRKQASRLPKTLWGGMAPNSLDPAADTESPRARQLGRSGSIALESTNPRHPPWFAEGRQDQWERVRQTPG